MTAPAPSEPPGDLTLHLVETAGALPPWADRAALARFLHHTMSPWQDTEADIHRALDYCFSEAEGKGGFALLAARLGRLAGAVVILRTGMGGYVPAHLLLFVSVDPELRGRGIGRRLIEAALARCDGAVKLHVEYDNPARRLYERVGFRSKYAEMRWEPPPGGPRAAAAATTAAGEAQGKEAEP